jgi:hypothetical protein
MAKIVMNENLRSKFRECIELTGDLTNRSEIQTKLEKTLASKYISLDSLKELKDIYKMTGNFKSY